MFIDESPLSASDMSTFDYVFKDGLWFNYVLNIKT